MFIARIVVDGHTSLYCWHCSHLKNNTCRLYGSLDANCDNMCLRHKDCMAEESEFCESDKAILELLNRPYYRKLIARNEERKALLDDLKHAQNMLRELTEEIDIMDEVDESACEIWEQIIEKIEKELEEFDKEKE